MLVARGYTLADHFDEARREYQAALDLETPADAYTILGRWAASEYRAGQTERAEELVAQAKEKAPSALAVAYLMLVESIRLKLDRGVKSRFDKEFKAGLEEPPTADSAAALMAWTSALHASGVVYHGQKTHAKKVAAYVEKASEADFTETQMERVCAALIDLKSVGRRGGSLTRRSISFRPIRFSSIGSPKCIWLGGRVTGRCSRRSRAGGRPAAGGGPAARRPAGQIGA